jgi:glutamyl-Q tRNA(Asp) synthetase
LSWEEPVLRQRDRFDAYGEVVAELERLELLYPAFMSRSEIAAVVSQRGDGWPRDPDGAPIYPGDERDWPARRRRAEIESGRPYALRLDMARALAGLPRLRWRDADPFSAALGEDRMAAPEEWGDVILARKEVTASYHLAVVVDDAYQQVTDVVRGRDLEAATSVHRLLQTLLGLPAPRYFHHRLILDADGLKLSKSRGSETLRARRRSGETPEDLTAGLGL